MLRRLTIALAVLAVTFPGEAQTPKEAQKDPQSAYEPRSKPGVGQKFLEKFVGDWQVVKTFFPRNGEPTRTNGRVKQTMVHGGRFLQSDFVFDGPTGETTGQGLIGFEAESGRFTSVWTDSRATRMSFRQSDAPFSGAEIILFGKSLGLDAAGPSKSRTVTRLEDDGRKIIHRQSAIDAENKERPVMELILTKPAKAR